MNIQELADIIKNNQNKKLRFFHGSSNSTRTEELDDYFFIDIRDLSHVLEVNEKEMYVVTEPNVPMDKLVEETLKYGFIPPVVMEFPGITVGGAVNGAALESSSFKYGQFNDTCLEYEIILGNGTIIKASPTKNADMFYGISGSYGTLGLLTKVKIKLVPATSFVLTTYTPTTTSKDCVSKLKTILKENNVDYIEAIIFDKKHSVVITGKRVDYAHLTLQTYTKARDPWFYETPRGVAYSGILHEEMIPLMDYLFRYNRGGFWMGELVFPILHLPSNRFTKSLMNPVMNTRKLHDGFAATNISQNYFLQDFYCPFNEAEKLITYSHKTLDIYPIWLCPIKPTRKPQKLSPHYIKDTMLLDVGIWGQSKKFLRNPVKINRDFESHIVKNRSRKMLYAHSYFTEKEFWKEYDGKWYKNIRTTYHADTAFPDVWEKTAVKERYTPSRLKGSIQVLFDTLRGKHLNT